MTINLLSKLRNNNIEVTSSGLNDSKIYWKHLAPVIRDYSSWVPTYFWACLIGPVLIKVAEGFFFSWAFESNSFSQYEFD